jgi:hypothetical protein
MLSPIGHSALLLIEDRNKTESCRNLGALRAGFAPESPENGFPGRPPFKIS